MLLLACERGPAEDFTGVEPDAETLLGRFPSYATPDAVARTVGVPWTVQEESSLPLDDARPRYDLLTVAVSPWTDHGHAGELRLTFFNARLMSCAFYPREPGAYRAALGEFAERLRHLRSQWAVDADGREYFVQSDDRLLRQQNRWVERYS